MGVYLWSKVKGFGSRGKHGMDFGSAAMSPSFNIMFLSIDMLNLFNGFRMFVKWSPNAPPSAEVPGMLNTLDAFGYYILLEGGGHM